MLCHLQIVATLLTAKLSPRPTGRLAPVTSFIEKEKSSRLLVNRQKALNSSKVMLCKKKAISLLVERRKRPFAPSDFHLPCWDLLPHVLPVGFIVCLVGVVKEPLSKVFPPHGVHTFGELQEFHLLDFSLQVLHEPGKQSDMNQIRTFSVVSPIFANVLLLCNV